MLRFHPLVIARRTAVADDAIALTFDVPASAPRRVQVPRGTARRTAHADRRAGGKAHVLDRESRGGGGDHDRHTGAEFRPHVRASRAACEARRVRRRVDPEWKFLRAGRRARRRGTMPHSRPAAASRRCSRSRRPRSSVTPASRFQLYYGNTSSARTMFLEDVLALKDRFLTRFSVAFVMSREPQEVEWLNGRIDAAKLGEIARHDLAVPGIDEYFVCGPGTMGEEVQGALEALGARGRIHVEHFTPVATGMAAPAAVTTTVVTPAPATGTASAEITVVMDGRRRRFTMPLAGRSDPRCRGPRGTRPAVLLSRGRLLDLPRKARQRQCRNGTQRRTRGLGGRGRLYSLLPGAADLRGPRDQLRRMTGIP